jgi:virulence factor Mce-like protein
MRRVLISGAILAAVAAFVILSTGASNNGNAQGTYKIEVDNAFGLVQGADFKVAGVKAGSIQKIELPPACIKGDTTKCHALVTVEVTQPGFGQFRSDVFCQTRPQSLIGEYFVECEPGSKGKVLKAGSTIPVTRTESTIPADLLANVMRLPYRQRLTLIINELGAAVAGRSGDLEAALRRAVPALNETDNLLNLLANDSSTLESLTVNSDQLITALANNSSTIIRFIDEANRISIHTANQSANLQSTLAKLPPFLEQLKPSLQQLGAATDANTPVLVNLNTAAVELNRLLRDLPGFSRSAIPALKSLGQASVTGKTAVEAAQPTIKHLNQFAQPTPELAQNLAIVGHTLDDRSRAVEPDPRSPGGKGYTGLEALLQYVFNQTLAINTFGPFGHQLAVDGFISTMCSPYATPGTIAMSLKSFGPRYRTCYAWLGGNQAGVNTTDPSNPHGCVPDPGGAPPGEHGVPTTACRLAASDQPGQAAASDKKARAATGANAAGQTSGQGAGTAPAAAAPSGSSAGGGSGGSGPGGSGGGSGAGGAAGGLQRTIGQILGALGGSSGAGASDGSSGSSASSGSSSGSGGTGGAGGSGGTGGGNQAQQLLNYLLAP